MTAHLTYILRYLGQSLWFVPAIVVVIEAGLAIVMIVFDQSSIGRSMASEFAFLRFGAEGARLMLSTMAGSIITVASLAASLTLVALTLASSQLGPRILAQFMADRATQFVLGQFIATFVYCLIVIRVVAAEDAAVFIPHFATGVAVLLSVVSFGLLIYFVHHVANLIQADTMIARLASDLVMTIGNVFPDPDEDSKPHDEAFPELDSMDKTQNITATRSGYIQAIAIKELIEIACKHDLAIEVYRRPGHFVIDGQVIARAGANSADMGANGKWRSLDEIVRESIAIGPKRTTTQDVELSASALVELAIRALSPGVNDFNTPKGCLDQLSVALAQAIRRKEPPSILHDKEGQARLKIERVTLAGLFDTAFDEIRQCARGNVPVTMRMIEVLRELAGFCQSDQQRSLVRLHAGMIARSAKHSISEPADRRGLARRLRQLRYALARGEGQGPDGKPSTRG